LKVAVRKRFVDTLQPFLIPYGRIAVPQQWIPTLPALKARPLPVFGSGDQFGAECVTLDVAEYGGEMLVILYGERLEPPLPNVSRGAVVAMVTSGVRREQPLHPTPEVAIVAWSH
jgi:hypothetical protein